MDEKNKQSKKNLNILGVGLVLIIFVAGIIFLKPYLFGQKNSKNSNRNSAGKNSSISKYKSLTTDELYEKMQKNEISVIDVREQSDFESGHLLDSENILYTNLEAKLESFNKNKEFAVVDNIGLTQVEIQSMEILMKNGFKNSAYLEGGINKWKNEYKPIISMGDPYSIADQAKIIRLSSEELKNAMSQGEILYIIDLRSAEQFRGGHLKGAVNIFLDDLEKRRKEIPPAQKIVLYDNDGLWAFQGSVRLFDMGIMNVNSLIGGLEEWKKKGFEIVK